MNSGVYLIVKTAFFNDVTITSSLRSVVQVLMGHFTIFLVTRIVRMIRAENYEKLNKFVKVTAKMLLVPFFRTRCMFIPSTTRFSFKRSRATWYRKSGIYVRLMDSVGEAQSLFN